MRNLIFPFLCLFVIIVFNLSFIVSSGQNPLDNQAYNGQNEVVQAQNEHKRHVEVELSAPVYKLLKDDTQGIPHQRFLIKLKNGTTILIAHDTNLAPYIPLKKGDYVRIHGEYIWTDKGGVIHWTHHSLGVRHPGGWIDYQGQRYQ